MVNLKRSSLLRIMAALLCSMIGYKLLVVMFAGSVPGRPFSGFDGGQWLRWALDVRDVVYVAIATLCLALPCLFLLRRLDTLRLLGWAVFAGVYLAIVVFPFALGSKIDGALEDLVPHGKSTILDASVLLVEVGVALLIPMASAWILGLTMGRNQ